MSDTASPSGTKTYLRLLWYVARYWFPFLIAVFGLLLHSLAEIAFIELFRYMTDIVGVLTGSVADTSAVSSSGFTGGMANRLLGDFWVNKPWLVIPLFLVLISAARGIGYLIGTYFLAYVANYLVHALRTDLFERYLLLPFKFFDQAMSAT